MFQPLGLAHEIWERVASLFPNVVTFGPERHWHSNGCLYRAIAYFDRERAGDGEVDAIALTVSGIGDPRARLRQLCDAFDATAYDVYENARIDLSAPVLPGWARYRARSTPRLVSVSGEHAPM